MSSAPSEAAARVAVTGGARLDKAIGPLSTVLPLVEELTARVEASHSSLRQILEIVSRQIAGIDQVSQAMEQIQGGMLEGVAFSYELERGAEGLVELGGQLQSLVSSFHPADNDACESASVVTDPAVLGLDPGASRPPAG